MVTKFCKSPDERMMRRLYVSLLISIFILVTLFLSCVPPQSTNLPDLVWIKKPTIEPLAPIVGDELHIKQSWEYIGTKALKEFEIILTIESGNVSLFEQSTKVQQAIQPEVKYTFEISPEFVIPTPGTYQVTLILDSSGIIPESSEDNNIIKADLLEVPDLSKSPEFDKGSEIAALDQAQEDIEKYRKGDVILSVVDGDGKPLSGLNVDYTQIEHSFLFGIFSLSATEYVWSLMKEAGINFAHIHLNWRNVEPELGQYNLEPNGTGYINYLRKFGFSGDAASLVWFADPNEGVPMPSYMNQLSFDEIKKAIYPHMYKIVDAQKEAFSMWHAIDEPTWQNSLNFTDDQMLQIFNESSRAIRDADPDARIIVENINAGYEDPTRGKKPYDFLQDAIRDGINFDIIGIECYYNASLYWGSKLIHMPRRSLSSIGELIDEYSTLGKTVHIGEMSVPSAPVEGNEGYWGESWSEDLQAEYLKAAYTIFFSKPAVGAITWWDMTDENNPFIYKGGLLDKQLQPKKSYYALKSLIRNWTTSGVGTTDDNGQIAFRGFGGVYEITITDPTTGKSETQMITIEEQRQNSITIIFDNY